MSLKEELLAKIASAPKVKRLEGVPILGEVYVRRLSGADRDAHDLFSIAHSFDEEDEKAGRGKAGTLKPGTQNIRAELVAKFLCDEQGNRLFSDEEAQTLSAWDGELLDYLWDEGRRFSGMGQKAQEQIRKNSKEVPSGGGGSA